MSDEVLLLAGYSDTKRSYFLHGFIGCILISAVAIWFNYIEALPLILAAVSLLGELWWRHKFALELTADGMKYGSTILPMDQLVRYTNWGPIGIPWTPIKLQGINIYLKTGKTFTIYSNAPGFQTLLQRLQAKPPATPVETVWYTYPQDPIRLVRYVIAFLFALAYMIVFAIAKLVLIVALVIALYLGYQKGSELYRHYRQVNQKLMPEKIWIIAIVSLIGLMVLSLLFLLLNKVVPLGPIIGWIKDIVLWIFSLVWWLVAWLPYLVGLIPIAILLWYPWRPSPLAVMADALFIGKNQAYPLRHMRTERTMSKFFIFKIWELLFANGEVAIYPLLEDLEVFKKKVLSQWEEVQKRYFGKPFTEEEAKVRPPKEEAAYLLALVAVNK